MDFAELLGELMGALGEGTMMRGEAERARGEAWRMCFGRGGRGRCMGGRGPISGMLFLWGIEQAGTYFVAGSRGRESRWATSSDEAWIVISNERVVIAVVLDVCREWSFDCVEAVVMLELSVSDCDEVSSMSSSGIDSVFMFGDELLEGLYVQGMASLIRSSSLGTVVCVSSASSFFATQGF